MRTLAAYIALASLSACAADIGDPVEDPVLEEVEALGYNALGYNALGYNALSANLTANELMTQVPLATETYDPNVGRPELMYALHDELTREFFKYLVSCALDRSQIVTYKDPFDSSYYYWRGEMGYCPKWGDPSSGQASDECQQVVSACLLSRVNAYGDHVRLSQRGHDSDGNAIALSPVVPAGATYLNGAAVYPLTKKCIYGTVGASRECAWRPNETGYCLPGSMVTVGLGAPPASNCSAPKIGDSYGADTVLRVCNGITGCKQADSTYLGQADSTCGMKQPSVTFTCPSTGFFTTMVGHTFASSTPSVPSWQVGVQGGVLGTEAEVFAYQEAAFYGNVFDPKALRPDANIQVTGNGEVSGRSDLMSKKVKGSIYGNMFACWSPIWTDGMAYATHRVCGGPIAENCAAVPVGACGKDSLGGVYPEELCKMEDDPIQAGDGDFQECDDRTTGTYWKHAMTVFLNHPCDAVPDANVCKNIYGMTPKNW